MACLEPGSPAQEAGLREGDLINCVGVEVPITISRFRERLQLAVTPAESRAA